MFVGSVFQLDSPNQNIIITQYEQNILHMQLLRKEGQICRCQVLALFQEQEVCFVPRDHSKEVGLGGSWNIRGTVDLRKGTL